MAGNRVDELESRVRELEATVSGLTDELLETKERLRVVEDQVDVGLDDVVGGSGTRSTTSYEEPVAQARGDGESRGPASQEKVEQAVERAADGETAADEAKSDESEGEDDGSGSDDIIVA